MKGISLSRLKQVPLSYLVFVYKKIYLTFLQKEQICFDYIIRRVNILLYELFQSYHLGTKTGLVQRVRKVPWRNLNGIDLEILWGTKLMY